ncbi:hypothetical protein B9479_001497 [Cryptococcus floricola]|uniref:Velvet domain-containing protein n=1 Tax=Cryptococcus floricola TaxID=2591691 RepID=A0A5D3B2E9_9TREE|nr:hypothetical protein B9479_001497 [Cryptococcus floricola]
MSSATGGSLKWTGRPLYELVVKQQPERARLCSYKEENDTIDRRPVDPPPVVELKCLGDQKLAEQLLQSTAFFVRAAIVTAETVPLTSDQASTSSQSDSPFSSRPLSHPQSHYAPVRLNLGADAATGEVVQTPERLRLLDGRPAALCIFAKLGVRLPGTFRLKFTLFRTTEDGLMDMAHTISEPFEVFSPKLFKGMHESTDLTRHLAAQGVKVKLRTDTTVGRQSMRRRRASAISTTHSPPFSGQPPAVIAPEPHYQPPHPSPLRQPQSNQTHPSNRPHPPSIATHHHPQTMTSHAMLPEASPTSFNSGSRRGAGDLVWRNSSEESARHEPNPSRVVSSGSKRRYVDDGLVRPPIIGMGQASGSYYLSAFSLSRRGSRESSRDSRATHLSNESTPRSASNQSNSYPFSSLSSTAFSPTASSSRSSSSMSTPASSQIPSATHSPPTWFPPARLNVRAGDDGIPILPPPNSHRSQGGFVPASLNEVLGESSSSAGGPGGRPITAGSGQGSGPRFSVDGGSSLAEAEGTEESMSEGVHPERQALGAIVPDASSLKLPPLRPTISESGPSRSGSGK